MRQLWNTFQVKAHDIRPFLRTKTGSRLAILAILDFVILFVAPLMHGFVGTAIFGCVATVYLILFWRKYDKDHVIVPTVILCIPMLLDMLIYHEISVVVGFLVAMVAMFLIALSPMFSFFDNINDRMTSLLTAGGICVAVVVIACVMLVLVNVAWWILCIVAFLVVVAIFMGVVFSTAAYTASDGRRQARRQHEKDDRTPFERYRDYRPRKRDNTIYNLDEKDFRDVDEPEDIDAT